MATDVIIDPSTGQIYWNDSAVSAQSISIKGDAQNTISIVGYSGSFSPGSGPAGATTLATFTDNSGTDALIPGTNGYDLGKDTARWRLFATSGTFSGEVNIASTTQSTSLLSGAIKIQGGLAVSSNASIGQTLFFYNPSNALFTAFRAGAAAASTTYTLPTNSPQSSVGTSVLSSTIAGVMSWVPLGSSSAEVYTGALYDVAYFATAGATVQGSSTLINNTASGQVKITHTTASFGTSSGALQVAGGVGISGKLSFNQASFGTTGITTIPTMAMIGQTGDPIFLSVLEDNSIVFEGSQGQLFSINPNLSTGYIWSVNDISGIPLIRANASGNVFISEFGGLVGLGNTNPAHKFHVRGSSAFATTNGASAISFLFDNISAPGSNTFQVKSANSIQLYNSADTFYTALKSNASTNVTYTLPATDGSNGQALTTNGSATLSWTTITGGSGGGGTGVQAGGEFEIAYYASTGASVQGSSTFKNDTTAAKVSITHTTTSISSSTGALVVSGGVGIGGSLWVSGIGASISGVRLSHSIAYGSFVGNVTGNVSGTVTGNVQGNVTGNVSGTVTGNVQGNVTGNVSGTVTGNVQGNVTGNVSGTVTGNVQGNVTGNVSGNLTGNVTGLATTSNNIQVAIGAENLSHTLLFTRPTSTVSGSGGIAVSNDLTLFFNPSTEILSVSGLAVTSPLNSTSSTTGALIVTGGVGIGGSTYIGGMLRVGTDTFTKAFSRGDVLLDNGTADTPAIRHYWANNKNFGTDVFSVGSGSTRYRIVKDINETGGAELFSVDSTGAIQIYDGGNYSGFKYSGAGQTIYTLPVASPTATGTSVLSSTIAGVMSWVPLVSGGSGSGVVNAGTANFAAFYATSSAAVSENANLQFTGTGVSIGGNITSISTATGSLKVSGGLGLTGNAFIGGTVTVQDSTASSSVSTGAVVISGGLGVAGQINSASLVTSGNAVINGTFQFKGTGTFGDNAAVDTITFNARSSSDFNPSANNTYDIGASSLTWKNVSIGSSVIFYNTSNANTLGFRAGASGASLIYVLPIDTPNAGEVLSASAPSGGVVTLSWEADQTGAPAGGITTLNTLTAATQSFATGTSGTDFAISSATSTHTFNLPDASATARGVITTGTQTIAGSKTFSSAILGNVSGNVTGNVSGNVTGGVSGNVTGNMTGNVSGNVTGNVSGNVTGNVVGIAITAGSTHVSVASAATAHAITVVPTTSAQVTVGIGQSIVSGVTVLASTGVITAGGFSGNVTGTVSGNVTGNLSGSVTGNVQGNVTGNVSGTVTGNVQGNVTGNVSGTVTGNVQGNVTGNVSGNLTGNVVGIAITSGSTHVSVSSAATAHSIIVVPTTSAQVTVGIGQSIVSGVTVLASTGVITAGGFSGNVTGNVSGTVTGNVQGNVTGNVSGTVTGNVQGNVTGNVSGNLTGNVTGLATTSYNVQVAIGSENLSHTLLFTRPSSTVSGSGGIAVSQDLTLFFNPSTDILSTSGLAVTSTTNSISSTSGALIVTGGASIGQSLSIGGRLQIFNSSLSTAFLSAQAGVNTTYTLPTTSPAATGTSVLSSTMAGVMSWVPLTSTVGGSGTPGGSNKQIQYNNASSFGGAAGFEYTTGGIAITVGFFAPSGLGYTSGLWVNAINGSTTRIGIGLSNPQFELEILGELSATNKSFVINHPTKSGLKLRYGSLEGPENGVYVRGELKGTNIIEVPDYWVGLVHEDSYTVHLTPIGKYTQLYVEKIENYDVFVAENNNSYIHCYYSVWAERKDIPKLVTEYEAQ